MASIRKKKNSANWFACYRIPTGRILRNGRPSFRRVQRSTGTQDPVRARAIAAAFDRAAVTAAERQWTRAARRRLTAEIDAIVRAKPLPVNVRSVDSEQGEFVFA
jgi:hypothetical protein